MEKQLELNAIPRKRVALVTEDKPKKDTYAVSVVEGDDGMEVHVKVPSCPPSQAVAEMWLGYTPWMYLEDQPPTVAGFYDFRDAPGTEPMIGRDVVMRWKFDPEAPRPSLPTRQWRGLSQPWPESFNPCLPQPVNAEQATKARRALLSD